MIRQILFGAAAAAMVVGVAHAAEIKLEGKNADGVPVVSVKGDFIESDIERFADVTKGIDSAIISFSSNGGRLSAGIEIGTRIRMRGFTTVVADREECYSACALAWLGGTTRYVGRGAQLGFHAAYLEKDGRFQETGVGNAVVGGYAANLGLGTSAIIFLTSAPPDGFNHLTKDLAETVRIAAEFMSSQRLIAVLEPSTPARSAPKAEDVNPAQVVAPAGGGSFDDLIPAAPSFPPAPPVRESAPKPPTPDELFKRGITTSVDNPSKAISILLMAAEQGHGPSMREIGEHYRTGRGIDRNYAEAVRWFRLAVGQKDINAQISLGFMYENGHGIQQDYAEAFRLYRLAAEQGNDLAQFNLANMYYNGWGVRENRTEAFRLYRLAAAQGLVVAQNTLERLSAVDLSGSWSLVSRCLFFNVNGWVNVRRTGEEEYYFDYENTIGETAAGHARQSQDTFTFSMRWNLLGNQSTGSLTIAAGGSRMSGNTSDGCTLVAERQ